MSVALRPPLDTQLDTMQPKHCLPETCTPFPNHKSPKTIEKIPWSRATQLFVVGSSAILVCPHILHSPSAVYAVYAYIAQSDCRTCSALRLRSAPSSLMSCLPAYIALQIQSISAVDVQHNSFETAMIVMLDWEDPSTSVRSYACR